MDTLEITVLVENTAIREDLYVEHGLSSWIAIEGKHLLFDTGMGAALMPNADALGIDLHLTDAVVLSHGHFDHTGGLPQIFELGISPKIFMHPEATRMRYGCLQTPPHKPIGMHPEIAESLSARAEYIVHTTQPIQIMDHVWVTGPIPRCTSFEDTGGPFFVDDECRIKDMLPDDQAIWIHTAEGIVV
ncbi:MAG TPA: MBL fold metallo-hydrolase, partial [Candidatus Hydrogenedentes bacterium]|nr:MBL fold metallo-hydrolase [Candidatus Hydrogenedentota bacterium]